MVLQKFQLGLDWSLSILLRCFAFVLFFQYLTLDKIHATLHQVNHLEWRGGVGFSNGRTLVISDHRNEIRIGMYPLFYKGWFDHWTVVRLYESARLGFVAIIWLLTYSNGVIRTILILFQQGNVYKRYLGLIRDQLVV